MLQSPGHSPLHISLPSPSVSEVPAQNPNDPPPPSSSSLSCAKKPTVLDEDTYVEALEKIIERDYFPDISKLRDRLDWLEAIKTGDPVVIREAQLKILERRGAAKVTNSTTHTPERFGYLDDDVKGIEDVKRDRITDGYGTSYQPPSTLEGWNYTAKNLLMYHPADRGEVPLTEEEMAVRIKAATKEIDRGNTRFHGKMMDSRPKDDGTVEVLYTPVAGGTPAPMSLREGDKLKKYDLDDLRKTPNPFYLESGKKAENGYSFVKTPSPAPGVDESPFITWGEIEGTPLRLDLEDTPLDIGGSADGPHYKIPSAPARDAKAHSLSREAARKLRERSKMFRKPPLASPVRGGSASPSMRTLSPAAQKFVRNAFAKSSSSVDETLRASYRGSTPALPTPRSVSRSVSRFGRDESMVSRSPSVREGSNPPW
uniref:Protein DGCR14 n=1 Tax=Cajanus cajan TaxID=3821 RepID=A0A151S078_CAJCA|nr:Protein DGCR14 [Cajanus cajan]